MSCTDSSQVVNQLIQLQQKFDLFINGDINTTIPTNYGTIKSLSGIIKDLETFTYVQKITDYETYSDLTNEISQYDLGMLFRVWNDSGININGIYQKTGTSTVTKVSYSTITDLVYGESVQITTILNAVTTGNTTSSVYLVNAGNRIAHLILKGTGTLYCTLRLYGNTVNNSTDGILIQSFIMTDLNNITSYKFTDSWPYLYAIIDSLTGTSANISLNVVI